MQTILLNIPVISLVLVKVFHNLSNLKAASKATCLLCPVCAETHAMLQPVIDINQGEFSIPITVSDSGSPSLSSNALVNVTVCPCDRAGQCMSATAAIFGAKVGVTFIALMIIMASVALLLCKYA